MNRLPPLGDPDPSIAGLLALAVDGDGQPLATIAALAHHPPLVGPFLGWAAALALHGALPKRDHELLALRTACRCHSDFEWDEHAGYARTAGLTDTEIARVREGHDAPGWSDAERLLLRAADELHDAHTVTDPTWAALSAAYPPAALVEVLYVVGQYTMLSMVANAIEG